MANKHGDFVWYELLTPDADGAQAFYAALLGWQVADSGMEGVDYRLLSAPDGDGGEVHMVGGIMPLDDDMLAAGARPAWLGYIAVDDVDARVQAIEASGGSLCMPATDIPGVGRIALVTDPQGAPFYIMRSLTADDTSLAFAHDRPRPGHCAWNELVTSDPAAALLFYGEQLGWVKDGEMDMGVDGAYEFIRHGSVIGAVCRLPEADARPHWNYYFRVAQIDAAVDTIEASGGQILMGPHPIPDGDLIIHALDPQGAAFALIGSRPG